MVEALHFNSFPFCDKKSNQRGSDEAVHSHNLARAFNAAKHDVRQYINPCHAGYMQTGTLANNEDPDNMQHYFTLHQGLPQLQRKNNK